MKTLLRCLWLISCGWMMFLSLPLHAQNKQLKQVSLTINSETGVFAIGDTVKVYGSLNSPVNGLLTLKIYDGGTRHYKTLGKSPLSQSLELTTLPKLIYQEVFNEPKSIILSVSGIDKDTASMVGFIVAPEKFRPGYDVPSDFLSYWDKQKAWLRNTTPKVSLTPVEIKDSKDAAGYELFSIEISMPEGNPVRGYMAKPKNASEKSLPVALWVHAAGVSGSWCRASASNALNYAKKGHGVIAIDFNAHGYPEDKPNEYYVDLENGELQHYSERPLIDKEHFYFRLMFLRELRALDYVCSLPEWDGKRVLVYGESQGGAQAEALAGLDKRVGAVVANVPAMTDFGGILQKRQSAWPPYYEQFADTPLGRNILPYFDGSLFLQFSRAKLFMVSGMIDETCPPAGVHAAYNAAASLDKQIHPFPYRWHSGTNKPFDRKWNETIGKAREEFINEYLK